MRLSLFPSLALSASLSLASLHAAADTPVYVFDTVDAYHAQYYDGGGSIDVTGVLHGASAATTSRIYIYNTALGQSCERALIQTINRPGRFTVSVYGSSPDMTCSIARNP